jgi:hypothetical protein
MSISSINTSLGSAAQSPQAPNLLNNAAATAGGGATAAASSNAKLNSDWLKIKVATPQQPVISHDEIGKEPAEKLKIPSTATAQISQTASNFVKHKIVVRTI